MKYIYINDYKDVSELYNFKDETDEAIILWEEIKLK